MLHDVLADALSTIKNADRTGKTACVATATKLSKEVLRVFQENNYIGSFELVDDGKSGKLKIEMRGKVIDCNVIKPRFSVKADEIEKFEERFLPSRQAGILVMTTPKGVMDHKKAKEMKTGGKLLAFVY